MKTALLVLFASVVFAAGAEPAKKAEPKKEKPFTPGGIYRQGDMQRPRPTVITPPTENTPPSDAIVLFDGKDLSKFIRKPRNGDPDQSDVPSWKIENGYAEIKPKGGDIDTKDKFGSCQIHLEWATPTEVVGSSQGRGNSGVLIHGWGEVQVLDSYDNDTYPDGQAAAIYNRYPPLVNASRKPGEWQSYDIICECAKIDDKGNVLQPARLTVIHNGVIVQHAVEMDAKVQEFGFALQDHHNPTRYRNIWVRPLHQRDENAKPAEATK
ncbi:DUF1080 domain-containing protein [Prosthecobacter sp.]|uniref:3-keto-disaccharide hydrolase n=1 Tax=Prosthecobacter sp. TaxID=1965333 RepID=UPI001E033544|nr:DUF1080 domain-containing protein [Prosthecobacter sp.]MCB1277447.1 DUF1080 domain-containing protein [Prosthecobacter sp.]